MHRLIPSQTSPWHGTAIKGSRYTEQQVHVMGRERPHWSHFDDRMVKLTYPQEPRYRPPEIVEVACPIIARTKDRKRVLVIAPAGDKIWMDAA